MSPAMTQLWHVGADDLGWFIYGDDDNYVIADVHNEDVAHHIVKCHNETPIIYPKSSDCAAGANSEQDSDVQS